MFPCFKVESVSSLDCVNKLCLFIFPIFTLNLSHSLPLAGHQHRGLCGEPLSSPHLWAAANDRRRQGLAVLCVVNQVFMTVQLPQLSGGLTLEAAPPLAAVPPSRHSLHCGLLVVLWQKKRFGQVILSPRSWVRVRLGGLGVERDSCQLFALVPLEQQLIHVPFGQTRGWLWAGLT